ncbi:hypothetical protein KB221_01785 [Aquidulcibacter paucihalophilus]|nr:hypothetical protein KB221_01785 [Aquidulcibacter paucihalophilus]
MSTLHHLLSGWVGLRSAWSRNDGKPREEWAPGVDLKELVLTGALVVVVATLAVVVIAALT